MVTVILPGVLREHAGGQRTLAVDAAGADVGRLLDLLGEQWPGLTRRIRDERGDLRRHVNVFVDGTDIRAYDGLHTVVADGAQVQVVPAVSGG
jgi:sulfur-carrier protein